MVSTAAALPLPNRWPATVRAELAGLRAALVGDGRGRLLDLAEPGASDLVEGASVRALGGGRPGLVPVSVADADVGAFDTVVSVAGLVHHPDLLRALAGIELLLAPAGEVHLVEPHPVPGWRGLAAGSLGALLPAVEGVHVGRDVAAAARAVGFVPTDRRYVRLPTAVWPLRWWAVATVVRREDLPAVLDRREGPTPSARRVDRGPTEA